jgi:hypothetical protein
MAEPPRGSRRCGRGAGHGHPGAEPGSASGQSRRGPGGPFRGSRGPAGPAGGRPRGRARRGGPDRSTPGRAARAGGPHHPGGTGAIQWPIPRRAARRAARAAEPPAFRPSDRPPPPPGVRPTSPADLGSSRLQIPLSVVPPEVRAGGRDETARGVRGRDEPDPEPTAAGATRPEGEPDARGTSCRGKSPRPVGSFLRPPGTGRRGDAFCTPGNQRSTCRIPAPRALIPSGSGRKGRPSTPASRAQPGSPSASGRTSRRGAIGEGYPEHPRPVAERWEGRPVAMAQVSRPKQRGRVSPLRSRRCRPSGGRSSRGLSARPDELPQLLQDFSPDPQRPRPAGPSARTRPTPMPPRNVGNGDPYHGIVWRLGPRRRSRRQGTSPATPASGPRDEAVLLGRTPTEGDQGSLWPTRAARRWKQKAWDPDAFLPGRPGWETAGEKRARVGPALPGSTPQIADPRGRPGGPRRRRRSPTPRGMPKGGGRSTGKRRRSSPGKCRRSSTATSRERRRRWDGRTVRSKVDNLSSIEGHPGWGTTRKCPGVRAGPPCRAFTLDEAPLSTDARDRRAGRQDPRPRGEITPADRGRWDSKGPYIIEGAHPLRRPQDPGGQSPFPRGGGGRGRRPTPTPSEKAPRGRQAPSPPEVLADYPRPEAQGQGRAGRRAGPGPSRRSGDSFGDQATAVMPVMDAYAPQLGRASTGKSADDFFRAASRSPRAGRPSRVR